jgi:hypothetical protein
MASDQRYCLECGARGVSPAGGGEPLDRLRAVAPAALTGGGQANGQSSRADPAGWGGAATAQFAAAAPGAPPGSSQAALPGMGTSTPVGGPAHQVRPNGTPAVIAGVGVLLLAMGVGVLIGRAGAGGGRAVTAPAQVISVASPGMGGAGAAPTTSTPSATTPAHPSARKPGKASASGAGSSLSKPAPSTVLQNLHSGGSGQSYEQKSKNLPNVVSTG